MKRVRGQSLLDYLWTNYGIYSVSDTQQEETSEYIPTLSLVINLLKNLSTKTVGGIQVKGNTLIVYSTDGLELNRIDLDTASSVIVSDFGSKLVTKEDIEEGCPFDLFTKVYYITLSNGTSYWASKDSLKAESTSAIETVIEDDVIKSTLILDEEQGNVKLSTDNGLKASLSIKNMDSDITFEYLTQEEYNEISPNQSTMYFIKDLDYLYFGDSLIGDNSLILEDITNIKTTLSWIEY